MTTNSSRKVIATIKFMTPETLDTEEAAKKYAMRKLSKEYKNCDIGEVYVNDMLIFKDIKISE